MSRKIVLPLLGAEAAICLGLTLGMNVTGLGALFSFPFAQLGQALRWMSLSGPAGNIAAVALYGLLCLIPAAFLLLRIRRGFRPEDALLGLMCGFLFFQMYLMVNPGLMTRWLGQAAGGGMGGAVLGGVFYSVLAAYLVLRFLRACLAADSGKLQRFGTFVLTALAMVLVFDTVVSGHRALLTSVQAVRSANQGSEHLLGLTYVFLGLRHLVNIVICFMDILVIFGAMRLLEVRAQDPYSDGTVSAAGALAKRCALALTVTVLANLAFHLLQLVFMRRLHTSETLISIPLSSLALVIAALLLAQHIREGKRLKDDNDLFI